jgi:hypothetical protein
LTALLERERLVEPTERAITHGVQTRTFGFPSRYNAAVRFANDELAALGHDGMDGGGSDEAAEMTSCAVAPRVGRRNEYAPWHAFDSALNEPSTTV